MSIDRALSKESFYRNHAENVPYKLVADPFSILVNNPKQPLHAEIVLTIIYFERRLSKSL